MTLYNLFKLYCGGTFGFDFLESGYRQKAATDYRAVLLGSVDLLLEKHEYIPLSDNLQYIGPFYFEAKGMIDRDIVNAEVQMIKECTHAIFLLDNAACPGTIAELILASSLGKTVEIFYIKYSDEKETESELHSPCWFPILMSSIMNNSTHITGCSDYNAAVDKICSYVKKMAEVL
ncbi:MAG: hypothetical protein IKZ86_02655 [Spirochaetaceae bacterium]|nr:hypothetical protein [Spirochaetaceae bacterium]